MSIGPEITSVPPAPTGEVVDWRAALLHRFDHDELEALTEAQREFLRELVFETSVAAGAARSVSERGMDPDPHGVWRRLGRVWSQATGTAGWPGSDRAHDPQIGRVPRARVRGGQL